MAKAKKTPTKKQQMLDKLSMLDGLGTQDVQENAMTVVEAICSNFIGRVQDNINRQKDFVTTGKISNITMEADGTTINVYAPAHLVYQSRGINGAKVKLYDTPHSFKDKMPPVDEIKRWIKNKQAFLTSLNDKYKLYDDRLSKSERVKDRPFKELTDNEKVERAAWGVARKIFNEGIKPKNLFEDEIPTLVDDLKEVLTNFAVQQIILAIPDLNPRDGGGGRIIIK